MTPLFNLLHNGYKAIVTTSALFCIYSCTICTTLPYKRGILPDLSQFIHN